jgi:S-adenosylmethionine:tRNA-ribosyltransferase-isomerase (queuine synthetase)
VGGNDRKILLEKATHPCPRCSRPDTVQLTRFESELILFNKRIALPRNMTVRYACKVCKWRNKALPDDDPSFAMLEQTLQENDCLFLSNSTMVEARLPSFSTVTTSSLHRSDSISLKRRKSFLGKRISNVPLL